MFAISRKDVNFPEFTISSICSLATQGKETLHKHCIVADIALMLENGVPLTLCLITTSLSVSFVKHGVFVFVVFRTSDLAESIALFYFFT